MNAPDSFSRRHGADRGQQQASWYQSVRQATLALAAPLSAEDCQAQSMPDASPVKWHLAHTTWFFETFLLSAFVPDYLPEFPQYRMLFNSYYNAVGEKHPRPQRGLLTRPTLAQVMTYRTRVDEAMDRAIRSSGGRDAERARSFDTLLALGLNHEQQHQELILTDVKHLLSCNPMGPAYAAPQDGGSEAQCPQPYGAEAPCGPSDLAFARFEGGIVTIGHEGAGLRLRQ